MGVPEWSAQALLHLFAGSDDPFASFGSGGHHGTSSGGPPAGGGDDAFDMWGQPVHTQQTQPRPTPGQALDPEQLMQPYLSPQSSPRLQTRQQPAPQPAQHGSFGGTSSEGGFGVADDLLDSFAQPPGTCLATAPALMSIML